jgi:hypothetical protein
MLLISGADLYHIRYTEASSQKPPRSVCPCPLEFIPSPCGKTAQFPPENIPGGVAMSDALTLTYILHFGRVWSFTSLSSHSSAPVRVWPTPRRWPSLASTPCDASYAATLMTLSSAKLSSRRSRMCRRTRRGEAVASFLLSHPHENIASIPSAGLPWVQTCWRSLRRTDGAGQDRSKSAFTPYLYCD